MRFRIPQDWLFNFADKLLKEAGIDEDEREADLESFIYEAGERNWDEYEDEDGDSFYFIEWDL